MTTNITTTTVSAGDSNKTTSISDMIGELDAAMSEIDTLDLTSANAAINAADFKSHLIFLAQNATVSGRTVTFSTPSKKFILLAADSSCTDTVEFVVGTTNVVLSAGDLVLAYLDGTSNGLLTLSGAGSGGGALSGLSDVVLTSPANNDVLTFDSGTSKWVNDPSGGGGGSTVFTYSNAGMHQDSSLWSTNALLFATLGALLCPLEDVVIDKVFAGTNPTATGQTWQCTIQEISTSLVLGTIVATNQQTTGVVDFSTLAFDFSGSPITLSSAKNYAVLITNTSAAGGTTAIPMMITLSSQVTFFGFPTDVGRANKSTFSSGSMLELASNSATPSGTCSTATLDRCPAITVRMKH